ncbi:MAG: sulfatase/phosphatase domain-containing protein, partial [Planctomycetota bacterium]
TLEKTKAADSTCVIFISDHGEMAFEHGQHAKMTLYDPAVRVPMIVTGPNVRPGVRDRLVSLVDIYPTLMDLAELPHPEGLDGRSLLPQISGEDVQTPNDVLCQYHGDSMNTGAFLLRRDDWKYIAYMGYPPQLFNLRDDPGELVDLAAIRPEIARAMDKRLREIVDCEAADARAKANDKTAFRAWRATQSDADYHKAMGGIYAGWDAEAARVIDQWLAVP